MKNSLLYKSFVVVLFICLTTHLYGGNNQKREFSILSPTFVEEQPNSILVMLPINNTNNVAAKDYFYASLYQFLVERGYYVFPPELSLEILQGGSAYDSEEFYNKDVSVFGSIFGADAVLFTIINKWNRSSSGVYVSINYKLVSTRSSKKLYTSDIDYFFNTDVLPTNYFDDDDDFKESVAATILSLISLTANSVSSVATPIMVSAMKANHLAFSKLPNGKYWVEK